MTTKSRARKRKIVYEAAEKFIKGVYANTFKRYINDRNANHD